LAVFVSCTMGVNAAMSTQGSERRAMKPLNIIRLYTNQCKLGIRRQPCGLDHLARSSRSSATTILVPFALPSYRLISWLIWKFRLLACELRLGMNAAGASVPEESPSGYTTNLLQSRADHSLISNVYDLNVWEEKLLPSFNDRQTPIDNVRSP
jgi:hypothetical protein